jgi:hypothetical protein
MSPHFQILTYQCYLDTILKYISSHRYIIENMQLKDVFISNIKEQTGLSQREIEQLIAKKQQDLKEISKVNVLYVICKEFAINVKNIFDAFQV